NISYNYETNSTYGYVLNTADINILSGNTAFNNSKNGFYISGGGNTLENNTASFNREHGFAMIGSFDTNLTNNLAYRNSENNTDYAGFYIFLSIDINLVNNTAYSTGRGFWLADSFNTLLENNTAHSNTYGLYLENGNNTIAYNTHLYNDSQYDLYVKNDGMEDLYLSFTNLTIDNPFGNFKNYTSLHLDDIIMHGETYEISWTSNTQPLPLGRRPFANKFVNISALHGLVSLDTVSWFWSDEEVTNEGVSEDKLELWKYNESGWTRLNNSPNIVFNFMTLTNHNPASKYGILEEVNCPIISSSGTYSQKANIGGAPNPAGIISESYYACVIINASNVEYDCAGYNITDTPSGNLTIGILINSSATNVTIKNCNIISNYTSAAILVFNASNATIFNTTVVNNMNGIVFVSSNFSKVYNNTVVNNTNSNFYLSVISSYNNISNNLIAFSERGFLISNGSSNNVFEYNIIQNHTDGVDILWVDSFLKTQNNTFYSNVFYNNTQFAFMIFNSSFDHYISNSISGGDAGFVTGFVDSAIFDSNNVSNTTYGFFVYQSNKNNLTFNQINDSYLAFFLNESSSNLVSTNKMYNLTYGAYFVYAVDNTFSNNSIQNVSRDGVYLRLVSNNNYIYNNTIFNTGRYGIYVDTTHNNTIDSNLVYYNINNAIALGNAQNNTIANNTVHSGNVYGISLSNSWYNKVLNNTGYNYTNSSAGYVLYLTSTSHYNNISYNKLYNGRYAYVLVSSSSNNILSYNYAENMTIDGYAIGDSSSNNTLMFNNATNCSEYGFHFYLNASNNTMVNNTAYFNKYGIGITSNATLSWLSNNTIHSNNLYGLLIDNGTYVYVENDHYYNNTNDIRIVRGPLVYNLSKVIIDNPNGNFENYTVLSLDDSVGAGEEYYINWSKNSTTLPSNRFSFASKFVDISILSGAPSIDSITWHWLDSELTGYNESKFELWKYNSSGWTMLNNTPDISNNVLSLTNMNPASTYGILQNNESECMVINESGVYILKNNITGAPYNIYLSDIAKELAVCIEINASDVEFDCQGYSIINNGTNAADGSAGILIDANRQNVTVKNCIVSNYSGGLVNYKAPSNFIYNNTAFNNSEYGMVLLYLSENNTVENNTAYDNTVGFFVYASNLNNFTNNSAYYNFDYGFLVYLGNGNRLTKNYGEANIISNFYVYSSIGTIITNNTGRTSNIGYLLYLNANNNYLYDNVAFLNNYGFYVYGSSENILENNTAYDNDYAGFMLNASANNNISNSIAYNTTNGSGFFLFESVGGVLRNISAFNNSNYGILLFDVNDTSLLYVNFSLNNWSGVYAQNSINLTLNNTITTLNNQSGLFIYSSENITLLNLASHVNKINGITLQSSENINITNAHLYNNSRDLYLGNGVAVPSRNVYLANITIDNPIGNLENYTVVDIVDSLETGTIYYINWSANPTGYPSSRISFNNKFIIIENLTSGVSIDSISWRWTDSELGVHDESLFELWKYNASGWTMLNNTPDIPNNVLSLTNMNPSSIYGILEVINCPLIDSPGTYIQGDNYRGAKNNAEPLIGFACVKITSSNVVYDCNGYNITDNGTTSFTNSYGILLNGSLKNVTLRNCNGVSNYSYGFYVYDSNDTIIFNSTSFNNVGPGFYIYGGFNNTLINNTAYNNSRGFEISMSLNVTLVSNEAFNNTDEGFNLISGTFFSILKDSRGAFNKRGFVLDFSYNATLINNTAYGNLEEGFYIYGGNNNTFENNTAYRNVQYGFVIYTSNNTFIRNLHLYNNSLDFGVIINTFIHGYLLNVSNLTIDNPHGNFENYTSVDIIDVLGDPLQSELYTINWSQNSTSLPNKRFSFAQKFINISSPLFANIDLISFRWLDSELGVHDESLFELWKYNASGWTMLNNTPDISNNVLSLTNMNPSSIYGILENNGSKCMLINESGKYNISNNIKGAPYTISLLDVGMEVAVCIEINASDVEFDCQGYSITNNGTNAADGSAGILIDANRQNVTVKNCVVSNYSHGIATYEASNNYIYNNTAYNNTDFGILLFYISNYNFVENNSLYYNGEGAGAYINSMNNNFTYNKVFNNSYYGIYIEGSDNNLILGNTLENHTLNNGKSIFVDESANTKIENNNFKTNYEHIRLEKSTYSVVSDNNLS
ncbi:MAG: right-handed parallel beta-helix repeat-containing protein, partial [Thermoplasmata archaeon]